MVAPEQALNETKCVPPANSTGYAADERSHAWSRLPPSKAPDEYESPSATYVDAFSRGAA